MKNICKLCQKREATKTNSHILPLSLIKNAITYKGTGKRGKENVYNISSGHLPSNFIGHTIIEENIEEIKSKFENIKIEEKDILSEDFIFCPCCENRFATIEGYFANNVIEYFNKNNIFNTDTRTSVITRKNNNRLIRLYVYSLFWRASISTIWPNFIMEAKDTEKLRNWLNDLMGNDINQTIHNIEKQDDIIELPFVVALMEENEDSTRSFISPHTFSKKPYMILADRYAFFLYFNTNDLKRPVCDFYGFSKFIKEKEVINQNETIIKYLKIFKNEREKITENMVNFLVLETLKNYISEFKYFYKLFFKPPPPSGIISLVHNSLARYGANINDTIKNEIFKEALMLSYKNLRK